MLGALAAATVNCCLRDSRPPERKRTVCDTVQCSRLSTEDRHTLRHELGTLNDLTERAWAHQYGSVWSSFVRRVAWANNLAGGGPHTEGLSNRTCHPRDGDLHARQVIAVDSVRRVAESFERVMSDEA